MMRNHPNRSERLPMLLVGTLLVLLGGSTKALHMMAQAPSATASDSSRSEPRPAFRSFDVVTIKPSSKTVGGMGLGNSTPDTISLANTSVRSLLAHAYGLPEWAIVGGPDWIHNTEYDIQAKILPDDHGVVPQMNRTEIREGIKEILTQRFGLISHFETRKIPVFELSVIGTGARLKQAVPGDTYPNGISGPNGRSGPGLMRLKDNVFIGQGIPISGLVDTLSLLLQRTIVDKTGLTGLYDIFSSHTFGEARSIRASPSGYRPSSA